VPHIHNGFSVLFSFHASIYRAPHASLGTIMFL
jgi:hypothetical protein